MIEEEVAHLCGYYDKKNRICLFGEKIMRGFAAEKNVERIMYMPKLASPGDWVYTRKVLCRAGFVKNKSESIANLQKECYENLILDNSEIEV